MPSDRERQDLSARTPAFSRDSAPFAPADDVLMFKVHTGSNDS